MGKTRVQAKVQACKLQVFAGKRRKYVQMSRHERGREFQPGYSEFVAFFLRMCCHLFCICVYTTGKKTSQVSVKGVCDTSAPGQHYFQYPRTNKEILALQLCMQTTTTTNPALPKSRRSHKNTNFLNLVAPHAEVQQPNVQNEVCEELQPSQRRSFFFPAIKYSVINMRQARIPSCESPLYQGRFHQRT